MLNFDFKRSARKCSINERPFESGEEFFSALIEVDGSLERFDFSKESWGGAPENCVGWWTSRMPDLNTNKVYWAPNHVLLAYFDHVYPNRDQFPDLIYVLAILLIQKRILQMIEEDESADPPTMNLLHKKSKTSYEVEAVSLAPQRIQEVQQELADNLFTTQSPEQAESPSQ